MGGYISIFIYMCGYINVHVCRPNSAFQFLEPNTEPIYTLSDQKALENEMQGMPDINLITSNSPWVGPMIFDLK